MKNNCHRVSVMKTFLPYHVGEQLEPQLCLSFDMLISFLPLRVIIAIEMLIYFKYSLTGLILRFFLLQHFLQLLFCVVLYLCCVTQLRWAM